MAVVYRFPDRIAAGPAKAARTDGEAQSSAEILILPCIRRERIELRQAVAAADLPAQLHA